MPKGGKPRYAEFGELLVYWMAMRKVKPGQLRKRLGIADASTISRWRKGLTRPEPDDLVRLAEALGVQLKDLNPGAVPFGVGNSTSRVGEPTPEGYGGFKAEDDSAHRAQAMAGQIILTRLAGRGTISVSEAIDYLAAVVDAAAGRPIKLPELETPVVGQTGTG